MIWRWCSATREKSSRNSLRHGFTSRHTILLECENEDEFQQLEEEFAETHQPATPAEQDLVDEMVAARWRIRPVRSIVTVIMDCEMVRKKAEIAHHRGARTLARRVATLRDTSFHTVFHLKTPTPGPTPIQSRDGNGAGSATITRPPKSEILHPGIRLE